MPPLITLHDIQLTFGGAPLLDGAELNVSAGERICLVGRNGSGKSTLLKIAAGLIEADRGSRFAQPQATIRYLPQEPDLSGFTDTRSFVEAGLAPGDDPQRAEYLLRSLALTGDEQVAHLSGGEMRRASLARILAPAPDILLLDEPTNHLDLPAIEWLESELQGMSSALVLVSHDRRFLQNLSRITLWLDRGRTRRLDSGFAQFEAWRDTVLEQEEIEQHKLDRKIVRELDWVRYGVSGRRKRNVRRMAELRTLRQQRRDHRSVAGKVKMTAADTETASALVIKAEHLFKSYGDKTLVRDVSIRILRGDRLGVVGPNGIGKTTLLNLLTGRVKPDSGTLTLGANIVLAALDQGRASLDPEARLSAALVGPGGGDTVQVGGQTRHVISYMKDFLFTPEQARTPVRVLSGGERARLLLAKALVTPSNLLVLDEPTNDLDLETLDLLQEMIADYPGTVVLVSHDRDFLDRAVTSVLMAEGAGRFVEYAGGHSDMVAQRGAGVAPASLAKPVAPKPVASALGRPALPGVQKRKLSFKDKHELAVLPGQIAELEAEVAALQSRLADQGLYTRDPARFETIASRLSLAQHELGALEERWLELEMLQDEQ